MRLMTEVSDHPCSYDKITMTVDNENFLEFDFDAFGFVSTF